MDTQQQHKKQYDWLKGYQWVKGQSGNPGGRPKGAKSMKTFARDYLAALPDEEKVEFLRILDPDLVWKMAEGAPQTDTDITSGGKPIPLLANLNVISDNNSNKEDSGVNQEN